MDRLETLLKIADKNNSLLTMLEGALIKLECAIRKEKYKYISLSHDLTSDEPIYEINIDDGCVYVSIGEIRYCINIRQVIRRLDGNSKSSVEDVEKALIAELEEITSAYFC